MTKQGLQRVIVEHVTPEIDAGRFYIKKTVGEIVRVEADLFTDGHDHTCARTGLDKDPAERHSASVV